MLKFTGKFQRLLLVAILISSCSFSFGQATHYVLNGNNSGEGSLRQILLDANSGDTIRFDTDVDTVFLTSGELLIDKSIVIIGNESNSGIVRSDTARFRILRIASDDSLEVELSHLTIRGGHSGDGTASNVSAEEGGGIFIPDSIHLITLSDCQIIDNITGNGRNNSDDDAGNGGNGGGISSHSELRLLRCKFSNNHTGNGGNAHSGGTWTSGKGGTGGFGGGIYCLKKMILQDCTISENTTGNGGNANGSIYSSGGSGGPGGMGAGLFFENGTFSVNGMIVSGNLTGKGGIGHNSQTSCSGGRGGRGGGITLYSCTAYIDSSEIFENVTGDGNFGSGNEKGTGGDGGDGGGLYSYNSTLNLSNSIISFNKTGAGGGSDSWDLSQNPGTGGDGGGVCIYSSNFIIDHCNINGNITGDGKGPDRPEGSYNGSNYGAGGFGGGLYIVNAWNGSFIISSNIQENRTGNGGIMPDQFNLNLCDQAFWGGNGAGIAFDYCLASVNIINTVIASNLCGNCRLPGNFLPGFTNLYPRGGSGGGIFIINADIRLINSTIANNSAGKAAFIGDSNIEVPADSVRGKGGGVITLDDCWGEDFPPEIINTILAYNYIDSLNTINDLEGACYLDYSLISSDTLATWTGNNNLINTDPSFTQFPDSLSVNNYSPAIDLGSEDTTGLFLPMLDLAGNLRIYGERIDMGAYEVQSASTYGIPDTYVDLNARICPNPACDNVTIISMVETKQDLQIIISDLQGRQLKKKQMTDIGPGEVRTIFSIDGLAAGQYLVRIQGKDQSETVKLIIVAK
jgi:hypothetical protein